MRWLSRARSLRRTPRGARPTRCLGLACSLAQPRPRIAFGNRRNGRRDGRTFQQPPRRNLESSGGPVNLVLHFEPDTGRLWLSPTAAVRDRSLELWLTKGDDAPVSLGVLLPPSEGATVLEPRLRGRIAPGSRLFVSVEPRGGSPKGAPTGAVIAQGMARVF
ncbi:hypothetical protein BMJ22_32220 [Sinorhizobium medicae]|nr:hypothetical protein BMJ22_32220 [Sinorhizobium medicae]